MIARSFEDDETWYDDPAVDDLPQASATLDDYLGLCRRDLSLFFITR